MHPTVIKTAALVLAGDLEGAEKALTLYADQEGDTALIALLDQVAPKDLLALLREYDGARESILNLVVTPKQFADALVLETLYAEYGHNRLRGMINAVLYREEGQIEAYLEVLCEKEGGLEALADYFDDRLEEFLDFAATGELRFDFTVTQSVEDKTVTWLSERIDEVDEALQDGDAIADAQPKQARVEIADNDWMETAWVLRYELPDEFSQLLTLIRHRLARQAELLNSPEAKAKQQAKVQNDDDEESAI